MAQVRHIRKALTSRKPMQPAISSSNADITDLASGRNYSHLPELVNMNVFLLSPLVATPYDGKFK
jgi:hypothetical protein